MRIFTQSKKSSYKHEVNVKQTLYYMPCFTLKIHQKGWMDFQLTSPTVLTEAPSSLPKPMFGDLLASVTLHPGNSSDSGLTSTNVNMLMHIHTDIYTHNFKRK